MYFVLFFDFVVVVIYWVAGLLRVFSTPSSLSRWISDVVAGLVVVAVTLVVFRCVCRLIVVGFVGGVGVSRAASFCYLW